MAEEDEEKVTTEEEAEAAAPAKSVGGREQVPAHVPPHLRELFTKHEGAVAARPGFRNAANSNTKAQRKKKKGKKKRR